MSPDKMMRFRLCFHEGLDASGEKNHWKHILWLFFDNINMLRAYISEKPNVTINCSSSIAVNVNDDVTCLCKRKGGYPPSNV